MVILCNLGQFGNLGQFLCYPAMSRRKAQKPTEQRYYTYLSEHVILLINAEKYNKVSRPNKGSETWHSFVYLLKSRVRTIVWKSDSPIVDSIGQNNRPMR